MLFGRMLGDFEEGLRLCWRDVRRCVEGFWDIVWEAFWKHLARFQIIVERVLGDLWEGANICLGRFLVIFGKVLGDCVRGI